MSHDLSVAAIAEGTVIDHIRAGAALSILQLLTPPITSCGILVAMYLKSHLMGKKDLIKMEKRFLTEGEASLIALYAPEATINIIRNYKVEEKQRVTLPESVEGLFFCPNSQCITRQEKISTKCRVYGRPDMPLARCHYCDSLFSIDVWRALPCSEVSHG